MVLVKALRDDSLGSNLRGCSSARAYALLPGRRANCAHRVAKACSDPRRRQARPNIRGHAGREINHRSDSPARARDSSMGQFLPDALPSVMGTGLLLFSEQLLHRGIWRCGSSFPLAAPGTPGEHHGCVDVWNFGECAVRTRHAATGSRHAILAKERARKQPVANLVWRID